MDRRFLLTVWLVSLALTSAFGQSLRVTELPQQQLYVTPGQYSGIAWVSWDRYAVVDDKLPGGGIVFFDIPLRNDGSVRTAQVRRTVPEATRASSVAGRDNEGVVYADGKLYVSAEGDQSIREYELDGNPTGFSFSIPADMGVRAIEKNGGFEAFTWNPVTRKCWTTTEFPLKADGKVSRLHRLQRFAVGHQADGRWLYQMDEPLMAEKERGAVMAYVHGISAMTALDDGRLLVLEREVYVPVAEPQEVLARAFTNTKLYLVNPSGSPTEVLPKQLLCEFETRIVLTMAGIDIALANYEGMCLGPRLPDGRRCLLLIADSQAGMASLAAKLGRNTLTREFVKVLLLEGDGI